MIVKDIIAMNAQTQIQVRDAPIVIPKKGKNMQPYFVNLTIKLAN